MAKGEYAIIDSKTRKIKKKYAIVDGKTRKIKKEYAVVDGKTRLVWSGEGLMYSIDATSFYKSNDGVNWTYVSTLPTIENTVYGSVIGNSISYANNTIIITVSNSSVGYVYSKDNGLTWTLTSNIYYDISRYHPNKIVAGNNIFVASAVNDNYDVIGLYSYDGVNWTKFSPIASSTSKYINDKTLDYVNGQFIWYGNANSVYSTDGVTWTTFTSDVLKNVGAGYYIKTIYNNGRYINILVSSYGIRYTDGITGSATSNTSIAPMQDIVYFKDAIFAVAKTDSSGMGGISSMSYILKSTDNGTSFTQVFRTNNESNTNVGAGRGAFIYTKNILYFKLEDGNYYYTTDGTTWTYVTASGNSSVKIKLTHVCYIDEI